MSEPFMAARPSCVQTSNGERPNSMTPIAYQGERVISSDRLAAEFGTTDVRIRQNHSKNPSRFVEGIHYFKVEGKELADLRVALGDSQISPMARSVVLWTERGALAHAKILETDEAWQVYDRLVDTYFAVKEGLIEPQAKKVTTPRLSGALLRELTSFPDKLRAAFPSLSENSLQAAFSRLSGQVEHWRWNAHGKSLVDAAIREWKTRGVSADVKR